MTIQALKNRLLRFDSFAMAGALGMTNMSPALLGRLLKIDPRKIALFVETGERGGDGLISENDLLIIVDYLTNNFGILMFEAGGTSVVAMTPSLRKGA